MGAKNLGPTDIFWLTLMTIFSGIAALALSSKFSERVLKAQARTTTPGTDSATNEPVAGATAGPAVPKPPPKLSSLFDHCPTEVQLLACCVFLIRLGLLPIYINCTMNKVTLDTFVNGTKTEDITLLNSGFWEDYDDYIESGAKSLAYVLLLASLPAPVVQTLVVLAIFYWPMTADLRQKVIRSQEFVTKFMSTKLYASILLFDAFMITFETGENTEAKIHLIAKKALISFICFTFASAMLMNLCRILHRYDYVPGAYGGLLLVMSKAKQRAETLYQSCRREKSKDKAALAERLVQQHKDEDAWVQRRVGMVKSVPKADSVHKWALLVLHGLGATAALMMLLVMVTPMVEYKYTGKVSKLLDPEKLHQRYSLGEVLASIWPSEVLSPHGEATFLNFSAVLLLAFAPLAMLVSVIAESLLPESFYVTRQTCAELGHLLYPWVGLEPLIVATTLLGKTSMVLISKFMFESIDFCDFLDENGEHCFVVHMEYFAWSAFMFVTISIFLGGAFFFNDFRYSSVPAADAPTGQTHEPARNPSNLTTTDNHGQFDKPDATGFAFGL